MLIRAFGAFEIEGKNKIPTNELSTILEMMGVRQSQQTIYTLMSEFDPWGKNFTNIYFSLIKRFSKTVD